MIRRVAAAGVLAMTLSACGGDGGDGTESTAAGLASPAPAQEPRLEVFAAFYPYWWMAQRVGGPEVKVDLLTEPGVEPHDLELSPRQVAQLSEVDLVVFQKGFQPAVDAAVAQQAAERQLEINAALGRTPVLDVHEGESEAEHAQHAGESAAEHAEHAGEPNAESAGEHSADDGHGHGAPGDLSADPHVWLDPDKLAAVATATADAFSRADAAGSAGYQQRASEVRADLTALNAEFTSGLATCARRKVVVNHAAFGHLTTRYGLEQIAVNGLSPDAAPSPQQLAQLAETIRRDGTTTVFTEILASPRLAETLAAEAGVKTATLDPLEGLAREDSRDFLAVQRDNLNALRAGLDCTSGITGTAAPTEAPTPTESASPSPTESSTPTATPTESTSPTP
ncbi:MAG: metal ABC transporter substrate-binding protein [Sporichthyaceae bacterium]